MSINGSYRNALSGIGLPREIEKNLRTLGLNTPERVYAEAYCSKGWTMAYLRSFKYGTRVEYEEFMKTLSEAVDEETRVKIENNGKYHPLGAIGFKTAALVRITKKRPIIQKYKQV